MGQLIAKDAIWKKKPSEFDGWLRWWRQHEHRWLRTATPCVSVCLGCFGTRYIDPVCGLVSISTDGQPRNKLGQILACGRHVWHSL